MKNVAVLLPGIIREYTYLEYINEIRKLEDEGNFKFYFFGICYDFQGMDKTAWHTHLDIKNDKKVDLSIVEKYNLDDLKVCTDIITEDADGYDGRILAQWTLVKDVFTMMEIFSKKNQIHFDCVVRSRWDLKIKIYKLLYSLNIVFDKNKISCVKYRTITDQSFMGPFDKMKKVCSIVDYYYDYLKLDKFIQMQETHTKIVQDMKNNPNKYPRRALRDRKNEFNLRFSAQSEHLLSHHMYNNFKFPDEALNVRATHKWWQLRKVKK
tara:strand:- start:219 stop:1016 length:798 start_codon:yes stop_codon:yes gene_type:complete